MRPGPGRSLAVGALCLVAAVCAAQNRPPLVPIERVLMEIRLGSSVRAIQKTYPPTVTFPKSGELKGGVERIQIRRFDCRTFPLGVDWMRLEFSHGGVVLIRAVFDPEQTRRESLEKVVRHLSQQYGEPRRVGMTYQWRDDHSQLSAFEEQLPKETGRGVELRTAIELVDLDSYPKPPSQRRNFDTMYKRLIGGY